MKDYSLISWIGRKLASEDDIDYLLIYKALLKACFFEDQSPSLYVLGGLFTAIMEPLNSCRKLTDENYNLEYCCCFDKLLELGDKTKLKDLFIPQQIKQVVSKIPDFGNSLLLKESLLKISKQRGL